MPGWPAQIYRALMESDLLPYVDTDHDFFTVRTYISACLFLLIACHSKPGIGYGCLTRSRVSGDQIDKTLALDPTCAAINAVISSDFIYLFSSTAMPRH